MPYAPQSLPHLKGNLEDSLEDVIGGEDPEKVNEFPKKHHSAAPTTNNAETPSRKLPTILRVVVTPEPHNSPGANCLTAQGVDNVAITRWDLMAGKINRI